MRYSYYIDERYCNITCWSCKIKVCFNKLSKVIQVGAVKGMKKILPESLMGRFQSFASKHSKVGGKRSAAMYGMMGELQDRDYEVRVLL